MLSVAVVHRLSHPRTPQTNHLGHYAMLRVAGLIVSGCVHSLVLRCRKAAQEAGHRIEDVAGHMRSRAQASRVDSSGRSGRQLIGALIVRIDVY
jgi:hypothetical protein